MIRQTGTDEVEVLYMVLCNRKWLNMPSDSRTTTSTTTSVTGNKAPDSSRRVSHLRQATQMKKTFVSSDINRQLTVFQCDMVLVDSVPFFQDDLLPVCSCLCRYQLLEVPNGVVRAETVSTIISKRVYLFQRYMKRIHTTYLHLTRIFFPNRSLQVISIILPFVQNSSEVQWYQKK